MMKLKWKRPSQSGTNRVNGRGRAEIEREGGREGNDFQQFSWIAMFPWEVRGDQPLNVVQDYKWHLSLSYTVLRTKYAYIDTNSPRLPLMFLFIWVREKKRAGWRSKQVRDIEYHKELQHSRSRDVEMKTQTWIRCQQQPFQPVR